MKISRSQLVIPLGLSLLVLIAIGTFGTWYAPLLGDAGLRFHHYLIQPLFELGGLPVTALAPWGETNS